MLEVNAVICDYVSWHLFPSSESLIEVWMVFKPQKISRIIQKKGEDEQNHFRIINQDFFSIETIRTK